MGHGHNKTTKKQKGWNVKESTYKSDSDPKERVSFDPAAFDRFLRQQGVDVCVYRSAFCPRVKSVDGAEHDIECPLCRGVGFIDVDPLNTMAAIQSQTLQHLENVEGFADGNHISVTFPIGVELSYFTLVEIKQFTDIFYERVMRNGNSLDGVDRLANNAKNVNFLIDYNGKQYTQDADFSLTVNGDIKWKPGRAPADFTVYTIHYEIPVRFRAIQAMHVNRFAQVKKITDQQVELIKMPEQWILAKEYLIARVDKKGNRINQGPYDNHTIVTDND